MLLRLLTAVPVALAATVALPAAARAEAPRCVATATPPRSQPGQPGVHASGTFACLVESFNLFVEVCVEELDSETLAWSTLGCSSAVLNDGGGSVTAEVTVDQPDDTAVLRTYVSGVNEHGDTASGTSAPVVWLRCGCP